MIPFSEIRRPWFSTHMTTVVIVLVAVFQTVIAPAQSVAAESRPNIILVMTDDQGRIWPRLTISGAVASTIRNGAVVRPETVHAQPAGQF